MGSSAARRLNLTETEGKHRDPASIAVLRYAIILPTNREFRQPIHLHHKGKAKAVKPSLIYY